MKKIMMMVAAIMMVATMAQAGCEQYEFSELNVMDKSTIIDEFCDNMEKQADYLADRIFGGKPNDYETCVKTTNKIKRSILRRFAGKLNKKELERYDKCSHIVSERFDFLQLIRKCHEYCVSQYGNNRGEYFTDCMNECKSKKE